MTTIILGNKYQIYEGDKLKIRRSKRVKSSDNNKLTYVLKEKNDDKKYIVSEEELNSKYIKLVPDAFLNIMITKELEYMDTDVEDVYFCVNRACDLTNGNNIPALILRQNCYSITKNIVSPVDMINQKVYVGELQTIMTTGKEELKAMMEYEEIIKSLSIAIYIDDSEEDILSCIPNNFRKSVESTLAYIKSTLGNTAEGCCDTIKQLWDENDFIGHLKSIFNIVQIDFPIILGKESYNSEGDIVLNNKQIEKIQDLVRRYISDVKVIKYDKDLDVSKIVTKSHVMVCDTDNEIYLIAYTIDGYYADPNDPGMQDIINAMTNR